MINQKSLHTILNVQIVVDKFNVFGPIDLRWLETWRVTRALLTSGSSGAFSFNLLPKSYLVFYQISE